jgi:hypothetical protein
VSNAGALGAVLYEAESSWGEDVTTFATHRIPLLDAVDASGLRHDKIDPQRVVQLLQSGTAWILGPMGGSFKTRIWATGHGSATTGATSTDAMETFLQYVFGGLLATAASGTTSSGGTATALTTAASATFHAGAGGIFRVGTLGDARGNGQAGVVSSHVLTTLTSLVAIDAAATGTDAVMPCINVYTIEDATAAGASITGTRFLLLTANYKYECHGCFPMSVSLRGTNAGEVPYWEIEWGVSWWRYTASGTFPSTVTSNQYTPAANAAGSMFLNDVGTATRAKRTYRSLEVNITLGVQPLMGPGGVNAYQTIVGAKRVPSDISLRWTEDSEAATASPALDGFFTGTTRKHMLVTLNPTNGASVAFYCPSLCITGARPVQSMNERINRIAIEAKAYSDDSRTDPLPRSAFRFGYS